jgi:hypothetical protein
MRERDRQSSIIDYRLPTGSDCRLVPIVAKNGSLTIAVSSVTYLSPRQAAGKQASRPAGRQADKQADTDRDGRIQTQRDTNRQAGRQASRPAGSQARQAGRRTDRQTDRQTASCTENIVVHCSMKLGIL